MTFGDAIEAIKGGHNAARPNWKGANIRLMDLPSGMGPCISVTAPNNTIRPWRPYDDDLLAEDWEVLYVH